MKQIIFFSILIFLICIALYLPRVSPSVYSADSGDLLAAIITNGVAHPPGYPLFIILGRFFNWLPISGTIAYRVGILSALSTSLTVAILFAAAYLLTKKYIPSIIASLTLGLIYTVWTYAEVVEAFALANLLSAIIVFLAFFAFWKLKKEKKTNKYLYWLIFFLGVALTHHHSIVLLFIPLVYLFYPFKKIFFNLKNITKTIFWFLLGFSIYINVYFATIKIPYINWDYPYNLENFFHLITRADYGSFTLKANLYNENFFIRIFQIWPFFYMLYLDWSFLGLILVFMGILTGRKKFGRFYWFLILALLFYGPIFMFYGAPVLSSIFSMGIYERFILLTGPFLVPFLACGISFFSELMSKTLQILLRKKRVAVITLLFQLVFLILPISLYFRNYKRTDYSRFYLGDNFGQIIFTSAKSSDKALLFVSGDDGIFTTWYYMLSRFKKPSERIAVIPSGLLGMKGMDLVIRKYYPWAYFPELSTPKNANELLGLYILKYIDKFPIYTSEDINIPKGFKLYPRGANFRIVRDNYKISLKEEIEIYQGFKKEVKAFDLDKYLNSPLAENFFVRDFINVFGGMFGNYAKFFWENKEYSLAKEAAYLSLKYYPEGKEMHLILGLVYNEEKNCQEAEKQLLLYRRIKPNLKLVYDKLIKNAKECFKDKKKEEKYKKEWDEIEKRSKKSLREL